MTLRNLDHSVASTARSIQHNVITFQANDPFDDPIAWFDNRVKGHDISDLDIFPTSVLAIGDERIPNDLTGR